MLNYVHKPLFQASFEHFDPFCRALNVMSESWSRLHRQNSVLNFIDAAFVTTDADANPAATTRAVSAMKNKKAKGKETSSRGLVRRRKKGDTAVVLNVKGMVVCIELLISFIFLLTPLRIELNGLFHKERLKPNTIPTSLKQLNAVRVL